MGSKEKNTIGWAKDWKRVGEGGRVWTMDRYLNLHVDGQLDRWINRESKYAPYEVAIQSEFNLKNESKKITLRNW
jgi:hypothetical protein